MARQVVGNPFENQIPVVSATAQVVDTYVSPENQENPFEQLSQSLDKLGQKKKQIDAVETKRREEQELAEGRELYNKTRLEFGDAVRKGLVQEGESPFIRRGYRTGRLSSLSMQYSAQLNSNLKRDKLFVNSDPNVINQYIADFSDKFRKDNNISDNYSSVEIEEFFSPNARRANAQFTQNWMNENVDYMSLEVYNAFAQDVATLTYGTVDPMLSDEVRKENAFNLQAQLQDRLDQANLDGLDNKKISDKMGDSLRTVALQTLDSTPLRIMEGIKTGTGSLAGTIENQEKNRLTRAEIGRLVADRDKKEYDALVVKANKERNELITSATTSIYRIGIDEDTMFDAKAVDINIRSLLALGDRGLDPEGKAAGAASSLKKLHEATIDRLKRNEVRNLDLYLNAMKDIADEPDENKRMNIITEGLKTGAFVSTSDIQNALSASKGAMGTPIYKLVTLGGGPVQKAIESKLNPVFTMSDAIVAMYKVEDRIKLQHIKGTVIQKIEDSSREFIIKYQADNGGSLPSEDEIYIHSREASDRFLELYAYDELKALEAQLQETLNTNAMMRLNNGK